MCFSLLFFDLVNYKPNMVFYFFKLPGDVGLDSHVSGFPDIDTYFPMLGPSGMTFVGGKM